MSKGKYTWATIAALLVLVFALGNCSQPKASEAGKARPEGPARVVLSEAELKFEPEIAVFDSLLKLNPIEHGIVFTGSSSIRKWTSLQQDMSPLPVENRGFGGAIIRQVTYYSSRMIYPLKPKLVVVYCGENDIANDVHSAEEPLADFRTLVATLRQEMPGLGIAFISMKPSPLRWEYWPKFQTSNKMIEDYIATQDKMWYLDVGQAMLGPNGRPEPSIFLRDSLHMNERGYAIWTHLLKPQIEGIYKTVQQ